MTMAQVFRENYRTRGIKWFFSGLGSCLVQSFMANGVCLPAYDYLNTLFLPADWINED
jgi:Mitochondrial carrier protein